MQYSLFTARRTSHSPREHAWLKPSRLQGCSVIFVRLKRICYLVLHRSHLLWSPHLSLATSFSSSPMGDLHTQQVHHAHLQALASRQAAPSRTTLARGSADWRKPAHHNSHMEWTPYARRMKERNERQSRNILKWC